MRLLVIFGASGGTGQSLVKAAARQGRMVRALGRAGAPPAELASRLTWRQGEFSDQQAVTDTVAGSDAVCCVFGPRFPSPAIFCAEATRAVVAAMKETGVRRLLCVTGAMIGDYPANRTPAFRLFAALLARRFGEVFADRQKQEEIVRASQLDWTILKPPRLTNGPPTGRVRKGTDLRVGMLSKLSRADLAAAILDELEQPRFLHQAVFLKSA